MSNHSIGNIYKRTSTIYDPDVSEISFTHDGEMVPYTIPSRGVRFFAPLADVNQIEFEVVE